MGYEWVKRVNLEQVAESSGQAGRARWPISCPWSVARPFVALDLSKAPSSAAGRRSWAIAMRRCPPPIRSVFPAASATADRKSTRLNSITNAHLVCRLLLEKKTQTNHEHKVNGKRITRPNK